MASGGLSVLIPFTSGKQTATRVAKSSLQGNGLTTLVDNNKMQPSKVRAIAWDPSRPAALMIPIAGKDDAVVHTLYSSTGTGCNAQELSALVKLVQAHEKFQETKESIIKSDAVKEIFRDYRSAISECVQEWQAVCNENDEQDVINLELLKMNYAVLHLSDIFLPLLPSTKLSSSSIMMSLRDPYNIPGLTTADTIRYFRFNHMREIDDEFPEYSEMMSCTQPEQFEGNLYWKVMTKLVMRGLLEEAWRVLSKHSLYTAATALRNEKNVDREYVRTMQDIETNFLAMRDLFLVAPLPGGRTNMYDNDFELPERIDEVTVAVLDDLDIQPLDYQYWEPKITAAAYGDFPIEFEAEAAKRKHKTWQDYLKNVMQAPFFTLPSHLPEISPILSILTGDIRDAPCDSWHEALVVELLYRQPDLRPKHLSNRARHVARELNAQSGLSDIEEALLNLMEGNAGEALTLLYVYGAGTGAALPAVLMALLCSLFVDSTILEESVSDRRIDFLCDAADSIQSSLSGTANRDIGIQLSVRLLLPYALELGERGEVLRSAIADILEHYAPSTERYARGIVSLVRPLVEKKSLLLLDATSTMLLSLYRQFMEHFDFQAAVLVLLDGLELEMAVLPDRELGSCYRTLSVLCVDTAEKILSLAFETKEELVTQLADAKVVGEAVTGAFVSRGDEVPEAMLLVRSMDLVASLDKDQPEETNDLILQILQKDVDRVTGGAVLRNLHWHVLRIAQYAIDVHATATFNTKCISALMERFLQLSEYAELTKSYVIDKQTVVSIETALAKGLAKAFVSENARKATSLDQSRAFGRDAINAGMNTSNMHHYNLDVQQRFVEDLLDS